MEISPFSPRVPMPGRALLGREGDLAVLSALVKAGNRLIMVSGVPGVGKTSFALQYAQDIMTTKEAVPLYVDSTGCTSTRRIIAQMIRRLGLRFTSDELPLLFQWLRSHTQNILLIVDHIQLAGPECENFSKFLDNLGENVQNVTIICISNSQFYTGSQISSNITLDDLQGHSEDLMRQLSPVLPDLTILELTAECSHLPFGLCMVGNLLSNSDIDAGSFCDSITTDNKRSLDLSVLQDVYIPLTEESQAALDKLVHVVYTVLEYLPSAHQVLLGKLARWHSGFGVEDAAVFANDSEEAEMVVNAIHTFHKVGLLYRDSASERYFLPPLVKCISLHHLLSIEEVSDMDNNAAYCEHYLLKLKDLERMFHSPKAMQAMATFHVDYDNIMEVLKMNVYEENVCNILTEQEMVVFLHEVLAAEDYIHLYESVLNTTRDNGEKFMQIKTMCSLSHHFVRVDEIEISRHYAEAAYTLLSDIESGDISRRTLQLLKAYCQQCLGHVYCLEDEEIEEGEGLKYLKQAMNIYKDILGMSHPLTLYCYGEYAYQLRNEDRLQMARHIFNLMDHTINDTLGDHPLILKGLDSRRAIWDSLRLFNRATDVAQRAVRVCVRRYGVDHPETANMYARLCDCIFKQGSAMDGMPAGATALRIRKKVYGEHMETAQSYKVLAYLMLRTGHYMEAIRYSQLALNICNKMEGKARSRNDIATIIRLAQTRSGTLRSVSALVEPSTSCRQEAAKTEACFSGGASTTV